VDTFKKKREVDFSSLFYEFCLNSHIPLFFHPHVCCFVLWVGLKCEAGPSLYVKKTPSRLVLGSTLFKICCCLTFILLPEGRQIHECAGFEMKKR